MKRHETTIRGKMSSNKNIFDDFSSPFSMVSVKIPCTWSAYSVYSRTRIAPYILQVKKFLRCDWLRKTVVHLKITVSMATEMTFVLIFETIGERFPECDDKKKNDYYVKENARNVNIKKSTKTWITVW